MVEDHGIYFVYDGECPLCHTTARMLRIRKECGTLHLINAREGKDDPVVKDIALRGLDLDEGMVIATQRQYYHGKDALKFMARYGQAGNILTTLFLRLFRSEAIASLSYPLMRTARNFALRCKGIGQINRGPDYS